MYRRVSSKKNVKKFFGILKVSDKGVRFGSVSQRSGSAPKCHGSPSLVTSSVSEPDPHKSELILLVLGGHEFSHTKIITKLSEIWVEYRIRKICIPHLEFRGQKVPFPDPQHWLLC
jgi:hypothetical protein